MSSKTRSDLLTFVMLGLVLIVADVGTAQTPPTAANQIGTRDPVLAPQSTGTHVDFDAYMADQRLRGGPTRFTSPFEPVVTNDYVAPALHNHDSVPRDDLFPHDAYAVNDKYRSNYLYQEAPEDVSWQLLPEGMVYDSYLAGTKEARFALHMMDVNSQGAHFAGFLGARVPLLRYGTSDPIRPEGFQIDVEGLAQVRIDLANDWVVDAADFRGGVPISYGYGRHRTKLGYYHLSSHVQDEFLAANPTFTRLNFSRDVFVLGHSYYLTDQVRIYGEVGYAFISDVSEPWEFQVGVDYAPLGPTGLRGAPFYALNGHLRQEVNFGGALTAQIGWAWVGNTGKMLRMGLHYYNGESNQYSFFDQFEQQFGFGVWYDF